MPPACQVQVRGGNRAAVQGLRDIFNRAVEVPFSEFEARRVVSKQLGLQLLANHHQTLAKHQVITLPVPNEQTCRFEVTSKPLGSQATASLPQVH